MAITKDQKRDIVAKLKDALKKATSIVFVRFNKLTVADAARMRKALKAEGVGYYVAKKTLLKRALAEHGYAGEVPELPGQIALAWGSADTTAPARLIHAEGKRLKGALAIVGGVFKQAFADAATMLGIAQIPSVPVLQGMFVNVINSPLQRFAVALGEVAKKK